MTDCEICQKRMMCRIAMLVFNLNAVDIAKEINVSDSLVRKHIDGIRSNSLVDKYFADKCFEVKA